MTIEQYSVSGRGPKIEVLKLITKGLKTISIEVLECIFDVLKDIVLTLHRVIAASCPIAQSVILTPNVASEKAREKRFFEI